MSLLTDKTMESAFKYAKAQTAHFSKNFFFSSQVLPKEKRWDRFVLYSFCRYADNIVDHPRKRADAELSDEVLKTRLLQSVVTMMASLFS